MEPVVLGRLKKQKSSKPAVVIICFMLLLGTCFGLPYIKDYINSKNDSFAIMVREILQKITGSDDEPVDNNLPMGDLHILNANTNIIYEGVNVTNVLLSDKTISYNVSSTSVSNLDEHKLFLEIYGMKDLLTRVKLSGKLSAEATTVTHKLYNLNINSGENYYGKIVSLKVDDYPDFESTDKMVCEFNNQSYTYEFSADKLVKTSYVYTNNDTANIDVYMENFNKYKAISDSLVALGYTSKTEETDSGFVFSSEITLSENVKESLGDNYDYNYYYLNAPLKEVEYELITKGFDCK